MGRFDAVTRYSKPMKLNVGRLVPRSFRVVLDFIRCSRYILYFPFFVSAYRIIIL